MLFGLDGVEIGLLIVFLCLFGGILSGFPVAFVEHYDAERERLVLTAAQGMELPEDRSDGRALHEVVVELHGTNREVECLSCGSRSEP